MIFEERTTKKEKKRKKDRYAGKSNDIFIDILNV